MRATEPAYAASVTVPERPVSPNARRTLLLVTWVFALGVLVMIPWSAWLAWSLPERSLAVNYDLAWAGFDVLLTLVLAAVAISAWRGARWLPPLASATASLLVVDAWFDVVTSHGRGERWEALLRAAFIELPLAVACIWLTLHSQAINESRLRARTRNLS